MLPTAVQLQTNGTLFSNILWPTHLPGRMWVWLNIIDSYLGIFVSLPVFPQPSPFLSIPPLPSLLSTKAGSKNSSELNSHNNMRLSGDRRSTVCAGQHRGSTNSKPKLLTARKHFDKTDSRDLFICCFILWNACFPFSINSFEKMSAETYICRKEVFEWKTGKQNLQRGGSSKWKLSSSRFLFYSSLVDSGIYVASEKAATRTDTFAIPDLPQVPDNQRPTKVLPGCKLQAWKIPNLPLSGRFIKGG